MDICLNGSVLKIKLLYSFSSIISIDSVLKTSILLRLQVVILTGVFCAILFVLIMSYARQKGLVGS